MVPHDDDRSGALDRWVEHGPGITWSGILWTAGAFALLIVLGVLNALKH